MQRHYLNLLSKSFKFFSILLIILSHSCSNIFGPEEGNLKPQNPVIIEFDQNRRDSVQKKWREFKEKYKPEYLLSPKFDGITSFFKYEHFKEGKAPRIYQDSLNTDEVDNLIPDLFDFIEEWKGLFGCSAQNLQLKWASYYEMSDYFNVAFEQIKVNGYQFNFSGNPTLKFEISRNGELLFINNQLIPDINLEIPLDYNRVKIIENMTNLTIFDGYGYSYSFDTDSDYRFRNGYDICQKWEDSKYFIYVLKGIDFYNVEGFSSDAIPFTVLCDPFSGEIVFTLRNYFR